MHLVSARDLHLVRNGDTFMLAHVQHDRTEAGSMSTFMLAPAIHEFIHITVILFSVQKALNPRR